LSVLKKLSPIIIFFPFLYVLVCLSFSRGQSSHALLGIENDVYGAMYPYLEKAEDLLPLRTAPFLCQSDLQRIHTGMGKIWYEKGKKAKLNKIDFYAEMQQSLEHYRKAIAINPHDILVVQGLAETMAALEFAFEDLFPGRENKYNAFPFFMRVSKVEPNGFESNYSTTRYLYKKGLKKELLSQVQHTAKIYPSYGSLKKEAFFSSETREAVKKGFEQAIKEKIKPRIAFFSLSTLAEIDNDFLKSADYYKKGLEFRRTKVSAENSLKLGRLLLKANQKKQAFLEFITALKKSPAPAKYLRTIYFSFKRQKNLNGFVDFAAFAQINKIGSEKLSLYVAQAQIEQKLFEPARQTLKNINAKKPNSRAYYLLAQLARKQKDWDAMELSIQKATVLEPGNSKYFNILADALIYQKKYKSAAEYMGKALENDSENQQYKSKLKKIKSKIN